ncbi:MAG TPA: CocE/NonD family hydrolase [Mycobacteriales bacterium]|nr:CocE/NonD family hydrolase [Mycobacteriales bacterium]
MLGPKAARPRRLIGLLLLVVIGLVTIAPAHADKPRKRWSVERWQATLSLQIYSDISVTTHYLTAPDGTQLSLTVHLPVGLKAGKKIPTLLQLTPYRPLDQAFGGYADFEFFVLRGAAYVEADERGTGGSQGCLDFGGSADRSDAVAFGAWIRQQPWSNGRIVTDGISHPGMGSVVAHAAIPGLTGAVAEAPVVSYYRDEWLQGAKFDGQLNGPLYQGIELAPPLPPDFADPNAGKNQAAACTGKTTTDFGGYDGPFTALWADRDLSRHVPKARRPILLTQGFVDSNVQADHVQLYWDALPDSYPKYAIFGWWYHSWPAMADHPAGAFRDVRHRWMDTLLFGTENGLWLEPRVLVQDSTLEWHESHNWPIDNSTRQRFYADTEGRLASLPGKAAGVSYLDDARAEHGTWENASVVFRTPPLKATRLVNGAPKVHLTGSSTEAETKWVAYLMDEAPDGTWQRISHGFADSHTWKGEADWAQMKPGQAYRWTLDLLPTAVVVEKGHRLTLVVASQDSTLLTDHCYDDYKSGCYTPPGILPAKTVGRATNTVHLGKNGTWVEFDWVDPRRTRKPPQ